MEMPESFPPLVLLNPAANRGNMQRYRVLLRNRAKQEQAEYCETCQAGEARERAMLAAQAGRSVIIVGGDGSVNEVVNGLLMAGKCVPLGIIAAGSGNDFAWYTLQLPRDPEEAIERAFHGKLVEVDAGVVNGHYFVNGLSVGLDADIGAAAGELKKIPFMSGARLYYAAILRQLLFGYHRCPWLKFTLDGSEFDAQSERRYILLAVSNGPTYGAGFRINPLADHADGLFDICAIDYTPLLRALSLLGVAKRGEHSNLPEVHFYRARRICIESRQEVTMQLDGETRRTTRFDAEILPGALWVRV